MNLSFFGCECCNAIWWFITYETPSSWQTRPTNTRQNFETRTTVKVIDLPASIWGLGWCVVNSNKELFIVNKRVDKVRFRYDIWHYCSPYERIFLLLLSIMETPWRVTLTAYVSTRPVVLFMWMSFKIPTLRLYLVSFDVCASVHNHTKLN